MEEEAALEHNHNRGGGNRKIYDVTSSRSGRCNRSTPLQYRSEIYPQRDSVAVIIDNGSHSIKAGWSVESAPRLNFRSMVGKGRVGKASDGPQTLVGDDLQFDNQGKLAYRSPCDGNVVTRFDVQEQLLDHVFLSLGINTDRIEHPILMTEAICNPSYCRQRISHSSLALPLSSLMFYALFTMECLEMSELLFECYGAPAVCYGIDAMFSYFYNRTGWKKTEADNTLIISSGHDSTHIIPVLSGGMLAQSVKRVPLGGQRATQFMQQLLHLKYPLHRAALSLPKAEAIKEQHCYTALDYCAELRQLKENSAYAASQERVLQLPFVQPTERIVTAEELERRAQMRREQGLRLKKMAEQKRAEKREREESAVKQLTELQELRTLKETDPKAFKSRLGESTFKNVAQLEQAIKGLEELTRNYIHKYLPQPDPTPKSEAEEFPLLHVDDSELSPEQLREKKKQLFIKNTREGRARAKERRDKEKELKEQRKREEEERRNQNPVRWAEDLQRRRTELLSVIAVKRRREEKESTRGSATAAKRMRAIAQAAFEEKSDKNAEDNFGANDEDWQVYKLMGTGKANISKQSGWSAKAESKEVQRIEKLLDMYEPQWRIKEELSEGSIEQEYQMHLLVERCRVPEVCFQPAAMIGVDSMGIPECLNYVIRNLPSSQQSLLVQNIFLTGGNCLFANFAQRIEEEVRRERPTGSLLRLQPAQDAIVDAWRGMSSWSRTSEFNQVAITRDIYEEHGGHYLLKYFASNPCYSLPQ
ncbi:Actin-related protein 5 [Balamuthia mandrillaris]